MLDNLDTTSTAPIELFFKNITEQVYDLTDGSQFPIQESKLRGTHCIIECQTLSGTVAPSDFGYLNVNAKPLNAEVCFRIDSWSTWNCGDLIPLPMNKEVMVRVTAKGYKLFTTSQTLTTTRQRLTVTLDKIDNRTLMVVGGVAAGLVVGALLISAASDGDDNSETFNITLVPPQ